MKKIETITPEQAAQFKPFAQKWIDIGLSTEPADFDAATVAALKGYELANLGKPMVVLRMGSPYAATLGGAYAWALLRAMGKQVGAQVRTQVGDQVGAQVGDQVWAQVWDQVRDQVWAQVRDQVGTQVGDQVGDQVRTQVGDQVGDQVWTQVGDQVRDQVRDQVWDQVGTQVGDQVGDQVWNQVWAQVRTQVGAQVGTQVRDQVWAQVGDQVGDQVWAQVRDQVRDQVGAQVGDQVWAQVRTQVGDQVGDQVWAQVRDQVRDQVGDQVGAQLKDAVYNEFGGQLWVGFTAYACFMRDVLGWQGDTLPKLAINEELVKSCGWIWWHQNVLAISDRPQHLSRDEAGRLHCETGPSIQYRDGWALYHWHGVSVPSEWITDKKSLTAKAALTWPNIEQRRAACEIIGWAKILKELDAKVIDKDGDPEIGTLLEVNLPDAGKERFIHVLCGTGREFAIPVPRDCGNTALEANAWTYGLDAQSFKPEVRT